MAIAGDTPIESATDDVLGRAGQARRFAAQVARLDASRGLVVGVLGPWGSGKTSFINLARDGFAAAAMPVIDFNPWMFSGAEQLVDRFFTELGEELKLRPGLEHIGNQIEEYGELFGGLGWLPFVGPWLERGRALSKLARKVIERRRKPSRPMRERLTDALGGLDHPLVVVLDDVDRLSSTEIREIFKLIRLTASFPNVIYVVAFDRFRVEQALSDETITGRAYLEKILQIAVDLPAVPTRVLQRAVTEAIERAVGDIEGMPFDQAAWPDTFVEIISPLIATMRDVRRYGAAIVGTVPALGGDVDLGDALALEAVRVFLPDVYAKVALGIDGLTSTSEFGYGMKEPPELRRQVEAVVAASEQHVDVVRSLVQRLFPAGARHIGGQTYSGSSWNAGWLRGRRVSNREILRLFVERTVGDELAAFLHAEQAIAVSGDSQRLTDYLMRIDPTDREEVIREMTNFSDTFGAEIAAPMLVALLNVLPTLSNRRQGMFDLDARFAVTRMIYLLLNQLNSDQVREITRQVLPQINSLWGRLELITSVGHRENAGHKFVTPNDAAQLEAEWRQQVRAAPASDLLKEKPLLTLLWRAKHEAGSDEPPLQVDRSPEMIAALLRSAVSDARSQAIGNRAVLREARLFWDGLVEVAGGEDELRTRIDSLRTSDDEETRDLLALCDRYFEGWRPD